MKAAPFSYHAPFTVAEAVETLAAVGDEAKVLAGGQSLVPLMALRLNDALAPLGVHLTRQPMNPSAIVAALLR